MPYVIRWPHKRVIALAATGLSLMVAAAPAAASPWSSAYQQYQPPGPANTCPIPSSSSVLSVLGDTSSYSLLLGGSFESPMLGWTLNGASVVPGNEPWHVDGSSDSQSLNISSGGYAVTPTFCLTTQLPTWRFFAQAADGSGATKLQVTALWTDLYGNSGQMTATTLNGGGFTSWQPTSSLPLGSVLSPGDVVNVRFVFSAANNGGAWNVDDVYVDPYAR